MTVLDEDMSECCSSEISYFIDEVSLALNYIILLFINNNNYALNIVDL